MGCRRGAVSSCEKAARENLNRAADESVSVPSKDTKQTALGVNLTRSITVEQLNSGEGEYKYP